MKLGLIVNRSQMTVQGQAACWVAEAQSTEACPIPPAPLCFSSSPIPDGSRLPSIPEEEPEMEGIPRKQRHRAAGSCPGIEGAWTILSVALLTPWDIIGVPQVSAPSWEHQRPSQMPELWTECLISVPRPPPPDPHPHFNCLHVNCLLTHLFGDLSASVCSSTGLRLSLPGQVRKTLGGLQGLEGAHGPVGGEGGPR